MTLTDVSITYEYEELQAMARQWPNIMQMLCSSGVVVRHLYLKERELLPALGCEVHQQVLK